jgi:hypothetical protein
MPPTLPPAPASGIRHPHSQIIADHRRPLAHRLVAHPFYTPPHSAHTGLYLPTRAETRIVLSPPPPPGLIVPLSAGKRGTIIQGGDGTKKRNQVSRRTVPWLAPDGKIVHIVPAHKDLICSWSEGAREKRAS